MHSPKIGWFWTVNLLTFFIYKALKFVAGHLQEAVLLCADFDAVFQTLLKVSPERRHDNAGVEVRRTVSS